MKWCVILFLLLTGCASYTKDGTRHTIVLGFGIVSTPAIPDAEVTAVKTSVVGVTLSDVPGLRFGVGYSSATSVVVNTNAQAIIEINHGPFGAMKLTRQ